MKLSIKQRVTHRLKIIQGHLKKIETMIEDDRYCVDVMTQLLAVAKSIRSVNSLILRQHLERCVVEQARGGRTDQLVTELLTLRDLESRT